MQHAVHEIMAKGVKRAVDMALLSANMAMRADQFGSAIHARLAANAAFTSVGFNRARNGCAGHDVC